MKASFLHVMVWAVSAVPVLLLGPWASAAAQDPALFQTLRRLTEVQQQGTSDQPEAKPDEAAAAAQKAQEEAAKQAEKAQKKAMRMQKIQQLVFDRRPSAIFEAWSQPEGDEKEEAAAASADAPAAERGAAIVQQDPASLSALAALGYVEIPSVEAPLMHPAASAATAPGQPPAEPDPFDAELEAFKRNVTLGSWADVKSFLGGLEEDEAKAAYTKLLQVLKSPPPPKPGRNIQPFIQPYMEKHVFSFEDVLGLADAAPKELDDEALVSLGAILKSAFDAGHAVESLLDVLKRETAKPEAEQAVTRREAAKLLFGADRAVEGGEFLPTLAEAEPAKDHEAMNLLARHHLALHKDDGKTKHLEDAWSVLQALFASGEIEKKPREEALRIAVELAPKIREELGQAWLEESFTQHPRRGMEIIAAIGSAASEGLETRPQEETFRLKGLQLQTTAVTALIEAAPDLAAEWKGPLDLLASNWLREALFSYQYDQSTGLGPMLQRDVYGNFFYYDQYQFNRNNQFKAIPTGELLEIRPGERWLELIEESARPKLFTVFAQLYLKVSEDAKAFPYIESLAKTHPKPAKALVDEFLRVWTRNHDPNATRNRTNYYVYMYGYEQKAESIPLTRSKQERNLVELSGWVERLRTLPIEELNQELLVDAFTKCHSSAEVYQLEAIESVFGSLDDLEPKTLAEIAQKMRTNLGGVWREPAVQEEGKTKRRQKDIQAEVLRGYQVAASVVEKGLLKHEDDWALVLAKASIDHDENNYRKELQNSSEFTPRRDDALAGFEKAAALYASKSPELTKDEETTKVYENWFYASLGACDLQFISDEQVPDLRQPERIRKHILALPGEAAERHMAMFANTLFTRMSAVRPAVKHRYLRAGFDIVGDHKQAYEARKVFDYYKDLVTEIQLEARIDGTDLVGHRDAFGLFVNIRHTREIERESGGFSRYLQNQNNAYFSYNYGRPTENYRDKFQEAAQKALEEHFEVLSVTFQRDEVHSRALDQYGWRMTPYAYILLKARGPEVDKVPPLRLDLDFLDTSGYAVLPIETPAVPIDARAERGEVRPISNLEIVQILDERQAKEGRLVLEVKASARGLVPDLEHILEVAPEGFEVVSREDLGLFISRFDQESEDNVILSERTFMVTMHAAEGLEKLPETFRFGEAKVADAKMVHQRYVDADLLSVEPLIRLEQTYGEESHTWAYLAGGGVLVLGFAIFGFLRWRGRRRPKAIEAGLRLPERLTPFTVLGLLREIESNNGFDTGAQQELGATIDHLERHYFRDGDGKDIDLHTIAAGWVNRATRTR